jgi:hypothetical protein
MAKRLMVTLKQKDAMQVTRVSIGKKKLVYAITVKKALKYDWGRSRIVYIGTTKKGMNRIAQSVAARADAVLTRHGVREFFVRIITCPPRPNVKSWEKLETALLHTFRKQYGSLPKCNDVLKREGDVFDYFRRDRLEHIIEILA